MNLTVNSTLRNSVHFSSLQFKYNLSNSIVTNTTSANASWEGKLNFISDAAIVTVLMMMMLAIGCEIHWKNILSHLQNPIPLFIGMILQFVVLPLFSFVLLIVTRIESIHAVGVLVLSCCPGGVLSNTFTYFSGGDLSLSVTMTTISTIAAMGLLPANTWIYCRHFASDTLVIPYRNMAMSVIMIMSPVIVGMLLKWKFQRGSALIAKIGTTTGILMIPACAVMKIVLLYDRILGVPNKLLIVVLFLPIAGFALGYGLAAVTKQKAAIRKTIGFETGVQNVPLALSIAALSFSSEMQKEILALPLLYGFVVMIGGPLLCFIYYCRKKCQKHVEAYDRAPTLAKLDDGECEGFELEQKKGSEINIRSKTIQETYGGLTTFPDTDNTDSLDFLFRKRQEVNTALTSELHFLITQS